MPKRLYYISNTCDPTISQVGKVLHNLRILYPFEYIHISMDIMEFVTGHKRLHFRIYMSKSIKRHERYISWSSFLTRYRQLVKEATNV